MSVKEKILEALAKLDPGNADHWTADGLPKLEIVREFTGVATITRQQIVEVGPAFNRKTALNFEAAKESEKSAKRQEPELKDEEEDELASLSAELLELKTQRAALDLRINELNGLLDDRLAPKEPLSVTLAQYFQSIENPV